MKLWRWIIKCPLLFLIGFGWLALTAFTWSEGRITDTSQKEILENPVFTALLEPEVPEDILGQGEYDSEKSADKLPGKKDIVDASANILADDTDSGAGLADHTNSGEGTEEEIPLQGEENSPLATDNKNVGENGSEVSDEEVGVTRFKKYKKKKTDSQYYSDPGKKALTTDFSYQTVDKSYFDDAVFIGDSRTVGMQYYSGLDQAAFFAKTGMNVYEILEDQFLNDPETGEEVSVAHMMKKYQYGKIYLMIGINELGTGNTATFQNAYERVLKKFRKWQPQAVIYIQGIIPVSKVKASEDEIFNNININDKNVAIAQLADGKNIFYLDVSEKLTDKKGYLKADYTFDEVHMYAQYYAKWTDYLLEHAVVR